MKSLYSWVILIILMIICFQRRKGPIGASRVHFADERVERIYDKRTGNILTEIIVDAKPGKTAAN